ncbi:MAG: hypothetical protein CM15mP12_5620 [Gammaproteobacteria bacterium]|nr:MAG: hypothetical protein CM15mP12_5620 [Gammaproteobacteria bacterium]
MDKNIRRHPAFKNFCIGKNGHGILLPFLGGLFNANGKRVMFKNQFFFFQRLGQGGKKPFLKQT